MEHNRKPEESIIKMMRRIFGHISPEHAEVRFDGVTSYPLFGGQRFLVGNEYGRPRTIKDLTDFLGDKGYIDYVKWVPEWHFSSNTSFNEVPSHWKYISFGIRSYDSSIWVVNTYLSHHHHQVGLAGMRFKGNSDDTDLTDPSVNRRHMVDTEDELFDKVIKLIMMR